MELLFLHEYLVVNKGENMETHNLI